MSNKILVVDDEPNIREILKLTLEKENFEVVTAADGAAAVVRFIEEEPTIVILDIMMPIKDGWETLREIRKRSLTPVIMLTARGEVFDKVLALELGADDYVVKPFDQKELAARVKAVLRRSSPDDSSAAEVKEVSYDNLNVNLDNYVLKVAGKTVEAPPKEMELLFHLAKNPNRVFTRDQLLDEVWGFEYFGDSRTVDVHIKRLREKLEGVSDKWMLKTVWGVGYKFETV